MTSNSRLMNYARAWTHGGHDDHHRATGRSAQKWMRFGTISHPPTGQMNHGPCPVALEVRLCSQLCWRITPALK
jgi:hypothetical protein